ncbi:PilN domain-containing protein [Candidatus Shapirobacteria bacterium]|nr:PilN domain-containing protein [Candidatus Shapirobacteria bacterium]
MAAPTTAIKTTIEFIPQEEWEKTSFGHFLKWLLGVGRWIVIVTELVVIIAFLSRFKLDRDLTDLHESVKQKQTIIIASSDFEKEWRFLQKRLTTIDGLKKSQLQADQILTIFSQVTPAGIQLSNFAVVDKKISFTASADSETTFAVFLKNLKGLDQITNLAIDKVSISEEQFGKVIFSLKADLKD